MNVKTPDEMMRMLLEACPSFESQWQEFLDEWQEEPPPLPYYLALGSLVVHMVHLLENSEEAELEAVFAVIDKLHDQGDDYVREAAVVGILEDLQNENLHTNTSPDDFLPFLSAQSKRWWEKLERYWRGDGQALADM